VIRIDPARMKVVKRIRLADQVWDVTYGAGSVWATEPNLGYVLRISPKTNKVRRRIRIRKAAPANLRYGDGAVWVGSLFGRHVFRIDARTNRVTSVRVGNGPRSVAVSKTAVWVSNRLSNTVSRINPRRRKVVATIHVGQQPENAAVARDGTVFVPNLAADTVSRIDPASNTVIETIHVGSRPFPAASAFGDIWVPSYGGTDVYRLRTG
jgi:YVTN family beta-propeller protein